MSEPTPILPNVTELNASFWEGTQAGELRLQRCSSCGHLRHPISAICPNCLSLEYRWETLSGRGSIFSWMRFQQGYNAWWNERLPYVVLLVELAEGPLMFSNIVGAEDDAIEVGQELQVEFVARGEVHIPVFRPLGLA